MFQLLQSGSSPLLTPDFVIILKGELSSSKRPRFNMTELSVPSTSLISGYLSDTEAWMRYWFEEERRNDIHTKEDQRYLLGEVIGSKAKIIHPDTSTKE